jgi:hypothetical protein
VADEGDAPPQPVVHRRFDMGITEAEFFRLLPAAVAEPFVVRGRVVEHRSAGRRWRIRLGPASNRAIGPLRLPMLAVSFEFEGYLDTEVEHFMARFLMYFRRGGG